MSVASVRREEFGDLLVAARQGRGLTQEELAEAAGLSVRAIREMERCRVRSPRRRTVAILADALGLSETDRRRFMAYADAGRLQRILASGATDGPPATEETVGSRRAGAVPGELPAAVTDLAGRDVQLANLRSVANDVRSGRSSGTSIVSLYGPPGIGKTTLAIYAGHQVADHFPDGQLFVDLRSTAEDPRDPAEVLAGFLRSLGLDEDRIPAALSERAGMYRTMTRGSRLLVVLDNAIDEAQVRPLLPAGRHCLVLITSRRPLSGLESVHRISVGFLEPGEARAMLSAIVGSGRAMQESQLVDHLVTLCGQLPLALRIVGNRLASRPAWRLSRLVDQLRDQRDRLAVLTAGDLDVRAAFQISYQQLHPGSRRLFRYAALIQGDDFDVELIAAVLDVPVSVACPALEEIVDAGLLLSIPDRYKFHDLIGLFARECLLDAESPASIAEANERMVRWLLRRTEASGAVFLPRSGPSAEANPVVDGPVDRAVDGPGDRTVEVDGLVDGDGQVEGEGQVGGEGHRAAGHWLAVEATSWLAALREAARNGWHREIVRTVVALHWYSDAVAQRHPWDEIFALGVQSARAVGDRSAEAVLLNFHGWALYHCRQRYAEALAVHGQALALARMIGDRREEAWALAYQGLINARQGTPERSICPCRRAIDQFRELGHRLGEHFALSALGVALCSIGRHAEALDNHRAVLHFYRTDSGLTSTGVSVVETSVLRAIGQDLGGLGRWREAAETYWESRQIAARCGSPHAEALGAYWQGVALRELGRPADAARDLQYSIALFAQLREPWGQALACHALAELGWGHERDADVDRLLRHALTCCHEVETAEALALAATITRALERRTGAGTPLPVQRLLGDGFSRPSRDRGRAEMVHGGEEHQQVRDVLGRNARPVGQPSDLLDPYLS